MKEKLAFVLLLCGLACGGAPPAAPPDTAEQPRDKAIVGCARDRDDDGDGIDDGDEDCLLARHAPVLQLPQSFDYTLPANVDWFLARATLRFNHEDGCPDHEIIPWGVTQDALVGQRHQTAGPLASLRPCRHREPTISSAGGPWVDGQHFFLQLPDPADHAGATDPRDWRVYGHVYPNAIGGLDVQYWFFYAFNDGVGEINHQGDWEAITVRTDATHAPVGVYFCAHGDCSTFRARGDLTWWRDQHPVVFVADGSHASYPSLADCENALRELPGPSCEDRADARWFTGGDTGGEAGRAGGGVINVGERDRPLNGQRFILYYSRWGEIGELSFTSGPITPSFKETWILP